MEFFNCVTCVTFYIIKTLRHIHNTYQEYTYISRTTGNIRRAHPFSSYRFRTDRIATRVACGCGVPQTASADCCS